MVCLKGHSRMAFILRLFGAIPFLSKSTQTRAGQPLTQNSPLD
jgi:hypothetical protein